PLPKFLAKRSVGGAMRKAKRAAERALTAQRRIGELQGALQRDDIDPEEYHATDQKIPEEGKQLAAQRAELHKEADVVPDARKYADDVDQKELRRELEAAKGKRQDKRAAEAKARSARVDADRHEASAAAIYRRKIGAAGGAEGTVAEAEAHEKRAAERRIDAARNDQEARGHGAAAKAHEVRARALRKQGATPEQRKETARQYKEKHGEKRNPYQDATGAGNVSLVLPSLLGHVPFPATVQIYMSWTQLLGNWAKAVFGVGFDLLKGYVGFVFDAILPPGQSAAAHWAMDFCKGLATETVLGAARKYVLEDRVSIKVETKAGPVSVSSELEQDPKTGEWTWKVSGESSEKTWSNAQKLLGPAEVGSDGSGVSANVFGHTYPIHQPAPPPTTSAVAPQPAATPGSPPPEPSYARTVERAPVDYSSGPALSGAPSP
ncbi:MAG TPA: hypothetical protein VJU61_25865, partial [Polyangiaceae bacterium]|nr:hypothetical protein [Polyangiaceae bacterium]